MENEKELYEVIFKGNVTLFKALINNDPLILDRISTTFFHESPLHVAVLRGHADMARELLSHNPRLVSESDSLGHSPLHLASAKGQVGIVRDLLRVGGHESCLARSKDGLVPLYVAIVKGGPVEVVEELVREYPESTRVRVDKGDLGLHLCVKFDNLGALQVIVKMVGENDGVDFLNARNDDGNTVLHLAALYKNFEIIKYLLSIPEIEQNATNNNGHTPLDLIENSPRDIKSLEILNFLLQSNSQKSSNSTPPISKSQSSPNSQVKLNPSVHPRQRSKSSWKRFFTFDNIRLDQHRGALLIIAAVIAVATALPVIDMNVNGPDLTDDYSTFSITFVPASAIMVLLVSGFSLRNKFCVWIVLQLMYTSIGFLAMNFVGSMISNESRYSRIDALTLISVLILFGLLLMVSALNLIRLIVWVVTNIKAWVKKRKLRGRDLNGLQMSEISIQRMV
ncbi:hypothetical protein RND81_04G142500 [Saponaria officinalis]|uniref:PGG domain-containing protein n=1 Tax=Saponaria officinalis TaxID=3572 RepID=A0AAW1LLY5_SAPOF